MKPFLAVADEAGNIREDPDLLMLMNRAGQWTVPTPDDLIPLPPESELFLLPGRHAVGLDPETGEAVATEGLPVAGFAAPGYTLSAHPAYIEKEDAPILPLFAYGAIGYADGQFWIAASQVDEDPRQQFGAIRPGKIEREAARLLKAYPRNRLVGHILRNCVARYGCPAARNFALGRYEAPLPASRACNAGCVGCISLQGPDSPIRATPQCRMNFTPRPQEIVEVMQIHERREKCTPIYSFGQGCEGDPLTNAPLLAESIGRFRASGGKGTINCNCNGSRPEAIPLLAEAGLTSMRISLHSSRPELYNLYHQPKDYGFDDVVESMDLARKAGLYISINLLYFPGITDTWPELNALSALCRECGVAMIQLRNLNIDPLWYLRKTGLTLDPTTFEPALGLNHFLKALKKSCPWLRFGYFNPYLGEKAQLPELS